MRGLTMARCGALILLLAAPAAAAEPDLRLIDAARSGDSARLRTLLESGPAARTTAADGSTALHWAVYRDDAASADLLLRAGADVNAANDLGVTPLWLAAENGDAAIAHRLIQAGARTSVALLSGETVLMTAARTGNARLVEELVTHGAEVNVSEHGRGQTALMWAVAQRHADVVAVLLAHGADLHARSAVYTQVVKTTPQTTNPAYIVDIQQGGFTPLLFAARAGDRASAQLLLAAGADVNDTAPAGTTALVVAAHSGQTSVATLLLEQGADPNRDDAGYTALHAALLYRDEPLVRALLAHGANPNAPVRAATPIRRDSVDFYLDPSFIGASPFWLAARLEAPELMRILAAAGADPRFAHRPSYWVGEGPSRPKDAPPSAEPDRRLVEEGTTTALMAAAGLGGRQPLFAVTLLDRLAESARGELRNPATEEARMLATVRAAAEFGIDVNAANAEGNTALHAVASLGYTSVAAFLIERGANVNAVNGKEETPLDRALAASARARSTVELLRKSGARD